MWKTKVSVSDHEIFLYIIIDFLRSWERKCLLKPNLPSKHDFLLPTPIKPQFKNCEKPHMTTLKCHIFQRTLIVEIRTLVAWLKSSLLLKIECQETHIYMKTECLQTKWNAASFWVERKKPLGLGEKRVGID